MWQVIDNFDCERCSCGIPETEYDDGDGICKACLVATIVCDDCGDRFPRDKAHNPHGECCEDCGEAREEGNPTSDLDAAKDDLDEVVESLVERLKDSEDARTIRKAIMKLQSM